MKVFIIGFMGSGKSTAGKRLARLLALPFLDADSLAENAAGASVSDIFAKSGESRFRELERAVLNDFAASDESAVFATGGGMPLHFDNMNRMLAAGVVVWLDPAPGVLAQRLEKKAQSRPLISGLSGTALREKISDMLKVRNPIYARAHIRTDAADLNAARLKTLAEEIRNYSR